MFSDICTKPHFIYMLKIAFTILCARQAATEFGIATSENVSKRRTVLRSRRKSFKACLLQIERDKTGVST